MPTLHGHVLESLQPLDQLTVRVWVPFFANTFPLAYHYHQAFKIAPEVDTWGSWSSFDGREPPTRVAHIFYASQREVNELHERNPALVIDSRCVTRYAPRWFFVDEATELARRARLADYRLAPDAAEVLRWYGSVEIVTDVPTTARALQTFLERTSGHERVRVLNASRWQDSGAFVEEAIRPGAIRIMFFGAPTTALLLRQERLFTRVQFPNSELATDDLDTHIVVAGPIDAPSAQSVVESLATYHELLFGQARKIAEGGEADSEFRGLWRGYEKHAVAGGKHDGCFVGPEYYAKCLSDHHVAPSCKAAVRPAIRLGNEPKWTVHVGAGNLGVGLVLPALNDKRRLIVLQRPSADAGGKWAPLEASERVTLRSSAGWSREFGCVFIAPDVEAERAVKGLAQMISQGPVFLLTKNEEVVRAVLANAEVISYSIKKGQQELGRLLHSMDCEHDPPLLVPIENVVDETAVPVSLPRALTVADMICDSHAVSPSEVTVQCEKNHEGTLWCLLPDAFRGKQILCSNDVAHVRVEYLDSRAAFDYWWKRKRYLMNGVHYLMAALSYDWLRRAEIATEEWSRQLVSVLAWIVLAKGNEYHSRIHRFIEFQAVRLATESKAPAERAEEAWQLYCHGTEVLERIRAVGSDRLGRILALDDIHSTLPKAREFLLESLRVMAMEKSLADVEGPNRGVLPDWFFAISSVLENVILALHSVNTRSSV